MRFYCFVSGLAVDAMLDQIVIQNWICFWARCPLEGLLVCLLNTKRQMGQEVRGDNNSDKKLYLYRKIVLIENIGKLKFGADWDRAYTSAFPAQDITSVED